MRDGRWQETGRAEARQIAAGPERSVAFERIIGRRIVEKLFGCRDKDVLGEVGQVRDQGMAGRFVEMFDHVDQQQ